MLLKKLFILTLFLFIFTPTRAEDTFKKVPVDTKDKTAITDIKSAPADTKKANEVNTPTDMTKPISVTSISPGFTIRLSANITTGYQWYLADYNPRFVRLLDQQYVAAPSKVIGTPGISVWQFQLQQISFTAPQVTHITFEYRRPWELKVSKKQSFTVISQQPTKGG